MYARKHGPYLYAYWRKGAKMRSAYVGKIAAGAWHTIYTSVPATTLYILLRICVIEAFLKKMHIVRPG